MCCRTMAIKELSKPANVWCGYCRIGTGCGIYQDRPESCRVFECLWLADEGIPEELRPDRSKVVLGVNDDGTAMVAYVDPKQQYAYNIGAMGRMLENISKTMPVIVVCGRQRKVITELKGSIAFDEEQIDGSVVRYIQEMKR